MTMQLKNKNKTKARQIENAVDFIVIGIVK